MRALTLDRIAAVCCAQVHGETPPGEITAVVTDSRGFVRSFIEKPQWERVVTDLVNTGIYVLGDEAMAAYQLANPLLLCIGAIGTLLSAGVQVACGRSLASGSQRETNAG